MEIKGKHHRQTDLTKILNYEKSKVGGKEMGEFQEAPGGGTPLPKGKKAPSKEWIRTHRKSQPRDENGQFTYNAVNGKELKYGPSRGTTISPLLKGIDLDKIFQKGRTWTMGKITYELARSITKEQLLEMTKQYVVSSEWEMGKTKMASGGYADSKKATIRKKAGEPTDRKKDEKNKQRVNREYNKMVAREFKQYLEPTNKKDFSKKKFNTVGLSPQVVEKREAIRKEMKKKLPV